ncbi:hypothetical protein ECG_03624 [Echinococcus granulosus]|nr:hypothetical protein ECG_03624 [Echinococcus granulosus]
MRRFTGRHRSQAPSSSSSAAAAPKTTNPLSALVRRSGLGVALSRTRVPLSLPFTAFEGQIVFSTWSRGLKRGCANMGTPSYPNHLLG